MFTLKAENKNGELLELTNNSDYSVFKIDGLSPMPAAINGIQAVGYDGGIYTGSRCDNRNISLQIVFNNNIENARQRLYNFFATKNYVRLYFKNANRNVYIDGYVESMEVDLFSEMQSADISIICFQPFFVDAEDPTHILTYGQITALFEMPFEIDTESQGIEFSLSSGEGISAEVIGGDSESGVIFFITLTNSVGQQDRMVELHVVNDTTGEEIVIERRMAFNSTERVHEIYINTFKGSKQVTEKVVRSYNTREYNLFPYMTKSDWISIAPGVNVLRVYEGDTHGSPNLNITAYCHAFRYYIGV